MQSAVLRSHVVCPSVCLSVTLVDCDDIGWNSSKIISRLVSLGCSLFATQTSRIYSKGNTPEIFAEIEIGCGKSGFRCTKALISLKHGKIGPRLLWGRIGSHYALSIGAKINDLGWTRRVIMHFVSKHVRLSERTVKIWMKMDLYCQQQRCSPMTLVSANIRFVPIFEGFIGDRASNDNGVIENMDCHGFRHYVFSR